MFEELFDGCPVGWVEHKHLLNEIFSRIRDVGLWEYIIAGFYLFVSKLDLICFEGWLPKE
jgi:hypothetical protein